MVAAIRGDEAAVHVLTASGANINAYVPPVTQNSVSSSVLPDLVGWTALTFAIASRHATLVQVS